MIDLTKLLDLQEGVDIRDGSSRRIKSLGSESTDGTFRLVFDISGEAPRLCLLRVLDNHVIPFRPRHLGDRKFSPTSYNGIDIAYYLATEMQAALMVELTVKQYFERMWGLIDSGNVTKQPDGSSDLIERTVLSIREATLMEATRQLYSTGIIGGEPLLAALRESRDKIAGADHTGSLNSVVDALDDFMDSWSALTSDDVTEEDNLTVIMAVVSVALLMKRLSEQNRS